jgi:hypothetical protein
MKVTRVFRRLCTKVIYKSWEAELMDDAMIVLCMLERNSHYGFSI